MTMSPDFPGREPGGTRPAPVVLVLVLGGLVVWVLYQQVLKACDGLFIYSLDDPYIHMAIAKNVAEHGIWGVTCHGFSFSSSSLLWPMILAVGFKIVGVLETLPFFLNLFIAAASLLTFHLMLSREEIGPVGILWTLILMFFLPPYPVLIFNGMEHLLHGWLTILFAYFSARALSQKQPAGLAELLPAGILAALLCLTRYEGLFLVFLVGFLFLARRRLNGVVFIPFLGGAPLALFSFYSLSHGWGILPNPVLLKGNIHDLRSIPGLLEFLGYGVILKLAFVPQLTALFLIALVAVFVLYRHECFWSVPGILGFLFCGTTLFHLQFAKVGGFFRYEAYLVMFGLFTAAPVLSKLWDLFFHGREERKWETWGLAGLKFAVFIMVLQRTFLGFGGVPLAASNIFSQQYQMGSFIKAEYATSPVAVNDIGVVTFFSDVQLSDLYGLADPDTFHALRGDRFDRKFIGDLFRKRGVKIAMVYESILEKAGGVPEGWTLVAEWNSICNIVCDDSIVKIYAVRAEEVDILKGKLASFSGRLPPLMTQKIF